MKAWSAFYPDVLPDLPGIPLPMVDHWLRNAAIEFCERSKVHVVDLALIDAVAEQMEYALTMPAATELIEIKAAWFSGEKITPKSPQFLSANYDDWTTETGTPAYYTHESTDAVLLVPAPSDAATGALKIKAAIRPAPDATGVDDWLYGRYRLAIAAGCKAALMAMNDRPWTNADLAAVNAGEFEFRITKATGSASNGFTNARPRFSGSFA